MEQVKKDMEADPKRKKDWEQFQKQSERMKVHGVAQEEHFQERLREWSDKASSMSQSTAETLKRMRDQAGKRSEQTSAWWASKTEDSESLRKAQEFAKKGSQSATEGSRVVFAKAGQAFSGIVDSTTKAFDYLGIEEKKGARIREWKASRDAAAAREAEKEEQAQARAQDGASDEARASTESAQAPPQESEASALVVSKSHSSSWDRFGAGLRDMPFLNNVFENPLFERMFGESEIAASIREMKLLEYGFLLEEFADDIEHVIAPHIIKTYLEGDSESLELHCGEAAFNTVNASIKARIQEKLTLDTNILAGPKDVELKGAKLMENGPPSFVWTFNMQQVNCLRDHTGEIVEGAVDDIRTVCYAMAVTRHPRVEEEPDLEYPWQVSELAILWNQPCW